MKVAIALVFLAVIGFAFSVEIGHCVFEPTQNEPNANGWARFENNNGNVTVTVYLSGLSVDVNASTGASHPLHVHVFGDVSDIYGNATGGHYNPANVSHACPPGVRHMGDTGNWDITPAGVLSGTKYLDLIQLSGTTSIIGRAFMYHQRTDDCTTQPTGAAGNRGAQCVIGISSEGGNGNTAAQQATDTQYATCALDPIGGTGVAGLVYFKQAPGQATTILAKVNGLDGARGFHIHQFGDLTNSTSTGGHYNPLNAPHAIPPISPRHVGDLGNIWYSPDNNTYYYNYTNSLVNLTGLYNVLGRAAVVHSLPDTCNATNLGARVAHCVIGLTSQALYDAFVASLPANIPATQDSSACTASSSTGAASGVASTGVAPNPTTTGKAEVNESSLLKASLFLMASVLAFSFA